MRIGTCKGEQRKDQINYDKVKSSSVVRSKKEENNKGVFVH